MIYSGQAMPYLIAFNSAEGVQVGWVVQWINKLWHVRLPSGMGCYVAPSQVLWLE